MKNQVKRRMAVRLANINGNATANSRVAAKMFPATPSTEKRSKGRTERRREINREAGND